MGKLQEERSGDTRQRLIEATVSCLFERGYAKTTTAEIAGRAGVSKGAQMYHFPKKDDLVVSALEYLFAQRMTASKEAVSALRGDRKQRLATIIDTLWPAYAGSTFYAWLELVVASRTDIALREAVMRATKRYSDEILKLWRDALNGPSEKPGHFSLLEQVINGQMAALALGQMLVSEKGEMTPPNPELLDLLKEIAVFVLQRLEAQRKAARTGAVKVAFQS